MMIAGGTLLWLSASNILNPGATCQDQLEIINPGGEAVLASSSCNPNPDPVFNRALTGPSNFILIVLSLCLASFGAAILGIITRL